MKEYDYDFRTGDGKIYLISCETCGKKTIVSEGHKRYCPVCGPDTVANINVVPYKDADGCDTGTSIPLIGQETNVMNKEGNMEKGTVAVKLYGQYFEIGDIVKVYSQQSKLTGRLAGVEGIDSNGKCEALHIDASSEYNGRPLMRVPTSSIASISLMRPNTREMRKLIAETSIGKIVAYTCGDIPYPGIAIDFIPDGEKFEAPVVLAEVKEACDDTGLKRSEFHLRPYVAKERGSLDENGKPVVGKVSWDAPYDDICLFDDEFANEE